MFFKIFLLFFYLSKEQWKRKNKDDSTTKMKNTKIKSAPNAQRKIKNNK